MEESATERELLAVDSEFSNCIDNDAWRYSQLRQSAAHPDHPASSFNVGNRDTLDKPTTREALLEFHAKYYKASRMNLCIVSGHSIEELCEFVKEKFSEIHGEAPLHPRYNRDSLPPAFGREQTGKFFTLVPRKNVRKLKVVWVLPSQTGRYRTKSHRYLSHLLGHEGNGSLHDQFLRAGWSTELSAGEEMSTSFFFLFEITLSLTPLGETKVKEILRSIFAYIDIIKQEDCPEWIYDECRALSDIEFRYIESGKPIKHATALAGRMSPDSGYPPEHLLYGPYFYGQFDRQEIRSHLDRMTPENMLLFRSSKAFEDEVDLKEPWFGTSYSVRDITKEEIQEWLQPSPFGEALHLPKPNPFIPTRFDVIGTRSEKPAAPTKIREEENCVIWYKADDTFMRPRTALYFQIITPTLSESPLNQLLGELFVEVVQELLSPLVYDAFLSGLEFAVKASSNSIQFGASGFSQSLLKLIHIGFDQMIDFDMDEDNSVMMNAFLNQKERLERRYDNAYRGQAYQISRNALRNCVKTLPTVNELSDAIKDITPQSLQEFAKSVFQSTKVICLCVGNITQEETCDVVDDMMKKLNSQSLKEPIFPHFFKLPTCEITYVYEEEQIDPESRNSALYYYYQIGSSSEQSVMISELFSHMIEEAAFDELRTKQQLGYLVWTFSRLESGTDNFGFIIQSGAFDPVYLQNRCDEFLKSYVEEMEHMPDEQFSSHVEGFIATKKVKNRKLSEEVGSHWSEIIHTRNCFNHCEKAVELAQQLTKQDMIEFGHKLFYNTPHLVVRIFPAGNMEVTCNEKSVRGLPEYLMSTKEEREEWKASLEIMPNPSPLHV